MINDREITVGSCVVVALLASGCVAEDTSVLGNRQQPVQSNSLADEVREAAFSQGLQGSPTVEFPAVSPRQQRIIDKRIALGRSLFFDQELGGVRHSSCGTCHHPAFHGADGQNIARGVFCQSDGGDPEKVVCTSPPPDGVGGNVVGPFRTAPLNERNSPTVINAPLFPKQMLDGRFHFVDSSGTDVNALDPTLGFDVQPPEGVLFTRSLLAAQAFKPVPSIIEMAGDFTFEGQPIPPAAVLHAAVQDGIAQRLNDIPAYRDLFEAAYPANGQIFPTDPVIRHNDPITFDAIADAMSTWEDRVLVMTDAPWDAFLLGQDDAMSESAKRGALVFFTRGKCSTCHSGDLFTDFVNYNLGVPQVGPGTGASDSHPSYGGETDWDFGAEHTTGLRADRFKFRTPPLRGVTLTPPYMHNGSYADLGDTIRHHVQPRANYASYDLSQLDSEVAAHGKNPIEPVFAPSNPVAIGPGTALHFALSDQDVDDLVEFLRSLTDPAMLDFANAAPATLPSGFPADVPGPRVYPLFQ